MQLSGDARHIKIERPERTDWLGVGTRPDWRGANRAEPVRCRALFDFVWNDDVLSLEAIKTVQIELKRGIHRLSGRFSGRAGSGRLLVESGKTFG